MWELLTAEGLNKDVLLIPGKAVMVLEEVVQVLGDYSRH